MANGEMISENSGNTDMFVFIKTLSDRLRPAGRMLVMDGQPEKLLPRLPSTSTTIFIRHTGIKNRWYISAENGMHSVREK